MSDRKRHRDEDEDRHNALTHEDREGEDEKKYKHEEKKHKKDISDSSESSESSSESEHEHKKHKKHKKEKKHKEHKEHKHKHKHKEHKKDKKRKEKLSELVKENTEVGEVGEVDEVITIKDYFRKNANFRVWLLKERHIYFDEITSDKAHEIFDEFVQKWNDGSLSKIFKQELNNTDFDKASRTRHKWGFVEKLDPVEMGNLKDSIESDTHREHLREFKKEDTKVEKPKLKIGPQLPSELRSHKQNDSIDEMDEEDRKYNEKIKQKRAEKKFVKEKEVVLDEILPKATGRDAVIEKKRVRAEQKRADDSPEHKESDIMGGGDDFHTMLAHKHARVKARQLEKEKKVNEKLAQHNEHEKEVIEKFKQQLAAKNKFGYNEENESVYRWKNTS